MATDYRGTTLADVSTSHWSYEALAIAKTIALIQGDEQGRMNGEGNITRAQAMTMVGRLLRIMEVGESLTEAQVTERLAAFADGSTMPEWARADAAVCIQYGIILGDSSGNLDSNGILTRAQCAASDNLLYAQLVKNLLT